MGFNSGFNPFKRRSKQEVPVQETGPKNWFKGKTEDGEVVRIQEQIKDKDGTLLPTNESLVVTVNDEPLAISDVERMRDGGTTYIKGRLPGGEERLIYVPSPMNFGEQPWIDRKRLIRVKD